VNIGRLKKITADIWSKIYTLVRPNHTHSQTNHQIIDEYDKRLVMSLSSTRLPKLKQIKYISKFFSPAEKMQIRLLILIAVVSLMTFGVSYFFHHSQDIPKTGGAYTEATVGIPQYINPVLAANDTDLDLTRLIYAGLLKYNERLQLETDLAESYEISEDNKTYTFKLKEGLTWHDGEPLNAEDVMFTITTIQSPRYASPQEPSFRGVKIRQLDNLTVEFTLDKPFAPFLDNLTVGIIPKHLWQTIPSQNFKLAELNIKPVGAGRWQFDSLKKDKDGNLIAYTIKPFTEYNGSKPYIANITFKFYGNINSALTALTEQNAEGLSFLPKDETTILANKKNITVQNLQLPQYTAIFLNQGKNNALKDIAVRKALAYATSKQKIVLEVFNGKSAVINGPLLPGLPGYDPTVNPYPFNVEQAASLLDDSGYTYAEGSSYRSKDETILEVTITTVDLKDNVNIANSLKQNWEQIGIKTNIQIVATESIQTQIIKPRNYELLLFGEILGADPDFYPFWHSSQITDPGLNLTDFSNKKVDALLEQARTTFDVTQRADQYKEFQTIINEQVPAIFLFQPTYSYVLPAKIKGFSLQRINVSADRFVDIANWYIKTKRRLVTD